MYYFFYLFSVYLCFMGIIYYIHLALSSNAIIIIYFISYISFTDVIVHNFSCSVKLRFWLFCTASFSQHLLDWNFPLIFIVQKRLSSYTNTNSGHKKPFHFGKISAPAHIMPLVFYSRCLIFINPPVTRYPEAQIIFRQKEKALKTQGF